MPTIPPDKIVYSSQEIDNLSFDDVTHLRMSEIVTWDGANAQRAIASSVTTKFDYDSNGNPIYIGIAAPGSASSSAVWQIKQLTFDGNGNTTDIKYAGGSPNFANIWDNRVSLSYS